MKTCLFSLGGDFTVDETVVSEVPSSFTERDEGGEALDFDFLPRTDTVEEDAEEVAVLRTLTFAGSKGLFLTMLFPRLYLTESIIITCPDEASIIGIIPNEVRLFLKFPGGQHAEEPTRTTGVEGRGDDEGKAVLKGSNGDDDRGEGSPEE
jgi:hypothetical protein